LCPVSAPLSLAFIMPRDCRVGKTASRSWCWGQRSVLSSSSSLVGGGQAGDVLLRRTLSRVVADGDGDTRGRGCEKDGSQCIAGIGSRRGEVLRSSYAVVVLVVGRALSFVMAGGCSRAPNQRALAQLREPTNPGTAAAVQ